MRHDVGVVESASMGLVVGHRVGYDIVLVHRLLSKHDYLVLAQINLVLSSFQHHHHVEFLRAQRALVLLHRIGKRLQILTCHTTQQNGEPDYGTCFLHFEFL